MPLKKLRHRDLRLKAVPLEHGIIQIQVSNRWSRLQGFRVTCYLVGDILVDTGFPSAEPLIAKYFSNQKMSAIACTHCHEDHAGNAGILAKMHDCPVYLANPDKQWAEGVGNMPFYRRFWWGQPPPYTPSEMPEQIHSKDRVLSVIPTPGHSVTQVAFFEEKTGLLFTGDLYVSDGASAVMAHENPYQTIQSLRRVANVSPTRMISSHGLIIDNPVQKLLEKADKMDFAADQILTLYSSGTPEKKILQKVFQKGRSKDWVLGKVTMGEFNRLNFVRACIRHAPNIL